MEVEAIIAIIGTSSAVIIYITALVIAFFSYIYSRDIYSEVWEIYSPLEEDLVYIPEDENLEDVLEWLAGHI